MPRVRDRLHRFRPAGTPGAAGAAGVPADRRADLEAELKPLLARLVTVEQECAEIREQGQRDASTIRDRAAARGLAVVSAARQRAEAERATTVGQLRESAEATSAQEMVAAEGVAAELHRRVARRIPVFVQRVVADVTELLERG